MGEVGYNSKSMSGPGAVIVEIDLKKKKLEEEIQQLERQLHRNEKKQMKEEQAMRKDKSRISVNSREEKGVIKGSTKETKGVKPAISESWKQQFRLDPQLYRPETTLYFDKDEYRPESHYEAD